MTPQVLSLGQAEPAVALSCSPCAHSDLHLAVPHTSELSPVGLTPAHHREDLAQAVIFENIDNFIQVTGYPPKRGKYLVEDPLKTP